MTSIGTTPIRTLLTIVGILAMMLMVHLTAPDSALAKDNAEDVNSVKATCEKLKESIGELEKKKKDGTITDHERGELNSQKELWDHLACDIVLAVKDNNTQPTGKPTGGKPGSSPTHAGNAGVAPAHPAHPGRPGQSPPQSPPNAGVAPADPAHPAHPGGGHNSPPNAGVAPTQ